MKDKPKKTLLNDIKGDLENLEVQLNLGQKEMKEAFEEKKKQFSSYIKEIESHLHSYEKSGLEKVNTLKKKASDLLDTLEGDFDVSYTEYSDKSHSLKTAIEDFEEVLKEYYHELEEKSKSFKVKTKEEINTRIEKFKHEIEIQQANLKQLKDKSTDEWESWKKNKLEEVKTLKLKINQAVDTSKEKAGKFNNEVVEAYNHLKKAFKNLT